MSRTYVSLALRRLVAEQARYRCGYCLTAEAIVGAPMEIDHIVPEADGGATVEDNLWLACSACNDAKSDRTTGLDPITKEIVRLFNPRTQVWTEHFRWNEVGDSIVGLTPTGRATVAALHMNRPALVRARALWVSVGWHPPKDAQREQPSPKQMPPPADASETQRSTGTPEKHDEPPKV